MYLCMYVCKGPIYERVAKLQRERRKRLEQLRESYEREMSEQLPFRPQMLTKKSHKSSVEVYNSYNFFYCNVFMYVCMYEKTII